MDTINSDANSVSNEFPVGPPPLSQGLDMTENYLALVRQLRAKRSSGQVGFSVGLTSCLPGEGVSTIAANLAVHAAESTGERVLLIDANRFQPSLQAAFQLEDGPGWTDLLAGRADLDSCTQTCGVTGLLVMPHGTHQPRSAPGSDAAGIQKRLDEIARAFDFVVLDLPVATEQSDCFTLAHALDGVVLVVEAERVRGPVVEHAKQRLATAGIDILGAILNKRRNHIPGWLYRRL